MSNCVINIRHHAHRHAETQVFLVPVLLGGRLNIQSGAQGASLAVAAHFNPGSNQLFHDARYIVCRDPFMHQNLLGGVAYRWPLCLGIDHNGIGHLEVCGLVDKDVAVPRPGLNHRHGGVLGDKCDEPRAAPRNDNVHQTAGLNEFVHRLARAGVEKFDCAVGHAGHCRKNFHETLIAVRRLFAAPQNNGVASLQGKYGRIDSDVRARFVNDSNHTQRNAHLPDVQAVGASPLG